MARRRNYADAELDELQRVKAENQKLKREIAKFRKLNARFDLDRFASFKEALDRIDEIEMEAKAKREERQVKKNKWACWNCAEGVLRITVLDRVDGPHYFRRCDGCMKRTKLKKWTPDVEKE